MWRPLWAACDTLCRSGKASALMATVNFHLFSYFQLCLGRVSQRQWWELVHRPESVMEAENEHKWIWHLTPSIVVFLYPVITALHQWDYGMLQLLIKLACAPSQKHIACNKESFLRKYQLSQHTKTPVNDQLPWQAPLRSLPSPNAVDQASNTHHAVTINKHQAHPRTKIKLKLKLDRMNNKSKPKYDKQNKNKQTKNRVQWS